jgi:hypothetical protein
MWNLWPWRMQPPFRVVLGEMRATMATLRSPDCGFAGNERPDCPILTDPGEG